MIVDRSGDFLRDLARALDQGLGAAALEGEESAVQSMPTQHTQAIGADSKGQVQAYVASRPGNPPHRRTGQLARSVASARLQPGVWGFGTNLKYGRFLELGTGRMAARPFLRPVLVRDRIRMERAFTRAASRSLARSVTSGRA